MVHLNPPQLHMHAAEEGAVQRVQPRETSKPARSSADKYPAPAIDKMMKFFAIMIRADHYLPVRNVVPVLSEMAVGAALEKDVQVKIVKPDHCLPELHIPDGSLKAYLAREYLPLYLADADAASGQAREHLGISTLRSETRLEYF